MGMSSLPLSHTETPPSVPPAANSGKVDAEYLLKKEPIAVEEILPGAASTCSNRKSHIFQVFILPSVELTNASALSKLQVCMFCTGIVLSMASIHLFERTSQSRKIPAASPLRIVNAGSKGSFSLSFEELLTAMESKRAREVIFALCPRNVCTSAFRARISQTRSVEPS